MWSYSAESVSYRSTEPATVPSSRFWFAYSATWVANSDWRASLSFPAPTPTNPCSSP